MLDLVLEELKSPTLTGEWEQKLEAIANGKLKKYTKEIVAEIKCSDKKYKSLTINYRYSKNTCLISLDEAGVFHVIGYLLF